MKKEVLHHFMAYTVLLIGMAVFVLLMFYTYQIPHLQRTIIFGGCFFYFLWGSITHVKTKVFQRKVLYEYAAISCLAAILLVLLTIG